MAKIVVIEDESALRAMIAEELEDLGHTVVTAVNGEQGLAAILEHRPQFVCCDVNMPVMNGLALKQKLNALGLGPNELTFIFVSARVDRNDIADGLMLGADHYLTKPIDMDRLATLVS
ncbi:response regulator transcription factor [Rubrimonas cliftonensis]|uniref:Response regulator receiver domain-containing protein n=1 Tax=Rubrimonas cliftonensis TaxID=89524 RepID=A0A1H4CC17_9RHOB|nr:response regulator [Rubrimonas cliftonensis]SEA57995.1 Response regulator receiver domain-containing protein [Rubrimonas cliftonensis]